MSSTAAILVTGASSGIGLATARVLHEGGLRVFAGVRRFSRPSPAWEEVLLDVTDAASISAARKYIETALAAEPVPFSLINNAGIGDAGPLEFTPLERFRALFDVNVFGVVAITQAFLPLLRRHRGRIVLIGSIGGMVTVPFGAALCASKHAIEAIADALRIELHGSGITVTCIQPASINSGSAEKLAAQTEETLAELPPEGRDRYADAFRHFMAVALKSETSGSPPEVVGKAVLEVLRSKKPPTRLLAGKHARLLKILGRTLPDRMRDRFFRSFLLGE